MLPPVEQADSQLKASLHSAGDAYFGVSLPEYQVVMQRYGCGPTLGPQLMSEIGDVYRFRSKKALVTYAGIDTPPYQSGSMDIVAAVSPSVITIFAPNAISGNECDPTELAISKKHIRL